MVGLKLQRFRTIQSSSDWNRFRTALFSSSSSDRNHTAVAEVNVATTSTSTSTTNHDAALADAIRPYFEKQTPVVLRGAGLDAPAVHRWQNTKNLLKTFSDDLPPNQMGAVEIGGSYSSANTGRAEIPIHDYLQYLQMFEDRHGNEGSTDPWELPTNISSEELVYMAQNDLPEPLYKDISIPGFCQNEERYRVGLGRLYSVMMWLGPRACVSPLHFDPLDNILMQFVGRKAVWLYDPKKQKSSAAGDGSDSGARIMWHYAGHEGLQSNTSPVNPERVDAQKYPLFVHEESPTAMRCVLHPGDMLYIPSKWWHFVRSIDTSMSVNVWWR